MYGLHGSLKAHPGQRDALVGHLLEGARALQDFEGERAEVRGVDNVEERCVVRPVSLESQGVEPGVREHAILSIDGPER